MWAAFVTVVLCLFAHASTAQGCSIASCPQSVYLLADSDCTCAVPDMTHSLSTTNCSSVVIVQSPPARTEVSVGTHEVTFNVTASGGTVMTCSANFTVLPPASKICSPDSDGDGDTSSASHAQLLPSSFLPLAFVGLPLVSALSTTTISSSTGFVGLGLLLFICFSFWPGTTSLSPSSQPARYRQDYTHVQR